MPPPAPSPPKSGGGLAARLTNKVGPLPVWAWAALILGLILLYMRLRPSTPPAASEQPPAGPETGQAGGVSGGGASGGYAGESNDLLLELHGRNAATIDSLTSAILTQRSIDATAPAATPGTVATVASGAAPSSVQATGPAAAPAPPPVTAPPGTTQRQANVLVWDGQSFTTKAGFNAWLKARGFNANQYLANKPQAKAIYSTLP